MVGGADIGGLILNEANISVPTYEIMVSMLPVFFRGFVLLEFSSGESSNG